MNQEQNNLNQNNFNIQGNNGIPNNQLIQNNQSFNQEINVNQQSQMTSKLTQPLTQDIIPQSINTFENGNNVDNKNLNSKLSMKISLVLIIGIVFTIVIVGVGIFFSNKLFSNSNNKNNPVIDNNNSTKTDIIYYDKSRDLKDVYTFKEAVKKFAFLVSENTLIFEENENIKLDNYSTGKTAYDELRNAQFNYNQQKYISLGAMDLGESSVTTLDEFINNFKIGKLSEKVVYKVENVNIIESNDEYVFASWENKDISQLTSYEYYFAKIIGNKVYYVYHTTVISLNETKIDLLLTQFKEFFTCLKEDDGKEPYIYDKIINVPMVLNKKITNVDYISFIINGEMCGTVTLRKNDSTDIDIYYEADYYYNNINWTKKLNSKIQYMREFDYNENYYGIKDNKLVQVIKIKNYSKDEIENMDELNNFMNEYLINK